MLPLPLKLVRSLVFGETINLQNPHMMLTQNHNHSHDYDTDDEYDNDDDDETQPHRQTRSIRRKGRRRRRKRRRFKTPALVFLPTREIIRDTYRLATIARDLGMDLYPTPSLSHIIFSNPSSTPSSSSSPTTPSTNCSFSVSSASCSLPNDAVSIPFPYLSETPLTHLRYFVSLSSRAFKIVLFNSDGDPDAAGERRGNGSNWDCCSLSLYSRVTGDRVDTMEGFCRVLAGKGWTFFRTWKTPSSDQHSGGNGGAVYLFRKVDVNRVRVCRVGGVGASDGGCRVRELRLPHLDFGNAPLRILQYILLMTDDVFCLA